MSRAIRITPLAYTVSLDHHNCGEASFTVTNVSGRPLRGRAELVNLERVEPSWLTIQGEKTRDFPVSAAHDFTVKIKVPLDAPCGKHAFQLRVASEVHPEQDFEDSPRISFTTEIGGGTEGGNNKFPWWVWLLIGLGALVVITVVVVIIALIR
jgi:hypothetical protein